MASYKYPTTFQEQICVLFSHKFYGWEAKLKNQLNTTISAQLSAEVKTNEHLHMCIEMFILYFYTRVCIKNKQASTHSPQFFQLNIKQMF